MNELKSTLDAWLSLPEVPPGHPLEPSHLGVLKTFYALLLVGTGEQPASPEPLVTRLLPGVPFRPGARPSRILLDLGVVNPQSKAYWLAEQLRASLTAEQAAAYLLLVGPKG